jgi:hypothetical protein
MCYSRQSNIYVNIVSLSPVAEVSNNFALTFLTVKRKVKAMDFNSENLRFIVFSLIVYTEVWRRFFCFKGSNYFDS